jgi:prepilin peptidase CpaA
MMLRSILLLLPMFVLLIWAAIADIRSRKIRNWLTLALAVSGILNSFVTRGAITPLYSVLGLLIGFAIPFALFALGALRGGDVKLLAGIGAWMGPVAIVQIFIVECIVGLVIVLVQCAWQGKLRMLFRNSAVLAINLAHIDVLGLKHVTDTGTSFKSIDRPLPYAVPVLVATIIVATLF